MAIVDAEIDRRHLAAVLDVVTRFAQDEVIDHVAPARGTDQEVPAVRLISHLHAIGQFSLTDRLDDPAPANEAHQKPDSEGATAEAEAIDLIAYVVVAAD